jgi:hypothetical protein
VGQARDVGLGLDERHTGLVANLARVKLGLEGEVAASLLGVGRFQHHHHPGPQRGVGRLRCLP